MPMATISFSLCRRDTDGLDSGGHRFSSELPCDDCNPENVPICVLRGKLTAFVVLRSQSRLGWRVGTYNRRAIPGSESSQNSRTFSFAVKPSDASMFVKGKREDPSSG